jgi:hypothetical protein
MDRLTTPAIATSAMQREVPLLMPAQSLRGSMCFCTGTGSHSQRAEVRCNRTSILVDAGVPIDADQAFHPDLYFRSYIKSLNRAPVAAIRDTETHRCPGPVIARA